MALNSSVSPETRGPGDQSPARGSQTDSFPAIPTAEEVFGAEPSRSDSDAEPSPWMEIADRECARLLVESLLEDPPNAKGMTWGDCPACGSKNTYWRNVETGKSGCRAPDCDWRKLRDITRGQAVGERAQPAPSIRETCLTEIRVEAVDWLWEPRIPRGMLTLLEGIEGEGKSTVLCAIAAAVTCGQGIDGMVFDKGPGNVLWLSAEDSPGHVLKPRLLAAGAEPSRVFVVGEAFTFDQAGAQLVSDMAERRKPHLIVIDPIFAYAKGDPSKGADARAVTNTLKEIAEAVNSAMVLVRHVGKSKGLGDPRAAGLYSIEWRAAARSVLLCGSDPDSPQVRALTQHKNNLAPLAESVGYKLVEHPPGSKVSRAEWTGVSQLTAKRILAQVSDEDDKAERMSAHEFLRELLKGREVKATEVMSDAKKNGIAEKTLYRAKARLGIESRSEGFSPKVWFWRLPDFDTPEAQSDGNSHSPEDGQTDDSDHLRVNDSREQSSGEKIIEDGHLGAFVGTSAPRRLPSDHLRENSPDNRNGSNCLLEDGHIGESDHLRGAQNPQVKEENVLAFPGAGSTRNAPKSVNGKESDVERSRVPTLQHSGDGDVQSDLYNNGNAGTLRPSKEDDDDLNDPTRRKRVTI